MAQNALIHCLGYVADENDKLGVSSIKLKASNGYSVGVRYNGETDTIISTNEHTVAHECLDSWDNGEYKEEEAEQWRKEGHEEIRNRLENFFNNRSTTVNI